MVAQVKHGRPEVGTALGYSICFFKVYRADYCMEKLP